VYADATEKSEQAMQRIVILTLSRCVVDIGESLDAEFVLRDEHD
jgi:hypothetical protein